ELSAPAGLDTLRSGHAARATLVDGEALAVVVVGLSATGARRGRRGVGLAVVVQIHRDRVLAGFGGGRQAQAIGRRVFDVVGEGVVLHVELLLCRLQLQQGDLRLRALRA